jgi:mannobiose 2-epimerase
MQQEILQQYKQELNNELLVILQWWMENSIDEANGGFFGQVNNKNIPNSNAEKGLVLNARILWTFSAASIFFKDKSYQEIAKRAYDYCGNYFFDKKYGGCFWSVDVNGYPTNRRKQIYGLVFMIYGLTEYYRISPSEQVLQQAKDLFYWVEKHSFDNKNGGYFEAFNEDGSTLKDLRLSPKDRNDPKTMNTHLHILEAYTNLYRIWQNDVLKQQIAHLIDIFLQYFIHPNRKTLILFFDEKWNAQDESISFGHDIEASWLIYEAAEVIKYRMEDVTTIVVSMAKSALKGIEGSGALLYENHLLEKHWWVQAEAMIGFFNAYQLTNDNLFLETSLNCWNYTKMNIIDKKNGEWYWGYDANNQLMSNEDKAGFWKCPYHNGRACIEICSRINGIIT